MYFNNQLSPEELLLWEEMSQDSAEASSEAPCEAKSGASSRPAKGRLPLFTPEILSDCLRSKGRSVRYNDITKQINITGMELENAEHLGSNLTALLYAELQGQYEHCSMQTVSAYLDIVASRNSYNPVIELIKADCWDGADRFEAVCDLLGLSQEDTLSRTLLHKWLLQCVALLCNNANRPFGADGVLVLTGPQGIGKTSFFRRLAMQPEFFKEGVSMDFRNKDICLRALSCWICELGEIESTFKSDIELLKAFITQSQDEYRLPYARAASRTLRRTSLAGTCNSPDFLNDPSGNRRFWTIPVQHIDLEALRQLDALQLWRQMFLELATHGTQSFRLTPDEHRQLAARNATHEKKLKAQEELEDILAETDTPYYRIVMEYQTVTDFKSDHEVLRSYSVQQISKALDKLGIITEIRKSQGKTQRLRLLPKRHYVTHQKH